MARPQLGVNPCGRQGTVVGCSVVRFGVVVPRFLCKCCFDSACLRPVPDNIVIANPGGMLGEGEQQEYRRRPVRLTCRHVQDISLRFGFERELRTDDRLSGSGAWVFKRGETEDLGDGLLQQFCRGALAAVAVRSRKAHDDPRLVGCNRVLFLERGRASK